VSARPIVTATLNARLRPLDRGELYEDPLDEALRSAGLGEVTGGGTQLAANGEIGSCDLEIELAEISERTLETVRELLERLGAPNGSRLVVGEGEPEIPFGASQGLGLYVNGTDLADEVYATSDVNHVFDELNRLLDGIGSVHSYWEGPTETALYAYGTSFEAMRDAIGELLEYPLCEKARVVQVA
jgi:hypothetical protein